MPRLTLEQLRKHWRPRMQEHGFACSSYFSKRVEPIEQVVAFQRSAHRREVRINLGIRIRDRFSDAPAHPSATRLVLHGCVSPTQVRTSSDYWWQEADIPGAVTTAIHYGLDFLNKYSDCETLIELLERALTECKTPEALLEPPGSPATAVEKQLASLVNVLGRPGRPLRALDCLGLLYFERGYVEKAVLVTEEYLSELPATNHNADTREAFKRRLRGMAMR